MMLMSDTGSHGSTWFAAADTNADRMPGSNNREGVSKPIEEIDWRCQGGKTILGRCLGR